MEYLSWETLGFFAGALTTFGYIPQILRLIKTKKAAGISFPAFGTLGLGMLFWFVYGIAVQAWPVVAANGLSFIFICLVLSLSIKYRQKK